MVNSEHGVTLHRYPTLVSLWPRISHPLWAFAFSSSYFASNDCSYACVSSHIPVLLFLLLFLQFLVLSKYFSSASPFPKPFWACSGFLLQRTSFHIPLSWYFLSLLYFSNVLSHISSPKILLSLVRGFSHHNSISFSPVFPYNVDLLMIFFVYCNLIHFSCCRFAILMT